jgi:hypothetical protein
MASAIVTGATGISTFFPIRFLLIVAGITGSAIVHHLSKDSSYEKMYSVSRHDPGYQVSKVQHAAIDLQGSADDMAKNLSGISAEYVYFCA